MQVKLVILIAAVIERLRQFFFYQLNDFSFLISIIIEFLVTACQFRN